jgi:hypothetical protein
MLGNRRRYFRSTIRLEALSLLLGMFWCAGILPAQEAPRETAAVKGTVSLVNASKERSTPAGLQLELQPTPEGKPLLLATTDAEGNYQFEDVPDGDYILRLEGEGFESYAAPLHVQNGTSIIRNISVKLTALEQKVEVKEQAEPLSTTTSSTPKLSEKQLSGLPLAEETFKQALPLTPGVIRTPEGKLTFRGSSEDQSMLQVNDAKMTDPVTGSFSIPVPLDAVQSVQVVKTPYAAENGGFSGGLTVVETIPPPESWKFNVRDLNVSVRGKNDHVVGISRATPRIAFGGPLLHDKLSFSEVFEYDVIRDPIRGLEWPHNEIKRQGFTSYSTLQAILSSRHIMTVTLNVFPQRTQFANITALIPQTASSDYGRKGESVSLSDVYNCFSGSLLRLAFNYTRFDSNARGQGDGDMQVTPLGWDGNFFNAWSRTASQLQAAPTLQFAQKHFLGRHEIRIGEDLTRRSYRANSFSHPVDLLRNDGSLAERITFSGPGSLGSSLTDVEEFAADHWMLTDNLALDLGGRITSQTLGRPAAFAPRFGIAYSPEKNQRTIFRAGVGLFYDSVPLLAADFGANPTRILSEFDPSGEAMGTVIALQNEYIANGDGPVLSRIRHSPNTSARSVVSNAEVDRTLWHGAVLRLGYLHSTTDDVFVVSPILGAPGRPGVLGLTNTGTENYNEAEAVLRFHPYKESELNISYVWSRSRGDLNALGDVFIPFEQPVMRSNVYGVRPSDVPNRVVAWGSFRLPYALTLSPVVDVHTGYPYSDVDDEQNYVGVPNSHRFPMFFSLDAQIYRDFGFPLGHKGGTRKIRFGVYVLNITNHRNFNAVYNDVTSPVFGSFNGFDRQRAAFLLSVVN